jgi:hypothetical protein
MRKIEKIEERRDTRDTKDLIQKSKQSDDYKKENSSIDTKKITDLLNTNESIKNLIRNPDITETLLNNIEFNMKLIKKLHFNREKEEKFYGEPMTSSSNMTKLIPILNEILSQELYKKCFLVQKLALFSMWIWFIVGYILYQWLIEYLKPNIEDRSHNSQKIEIIVNRLNNGYLELVQKSYEISFSRRFSLFLGIYLLLILMQRCYYQ